MAEAVGGDVIEVRWSHPTLGSGVLYPKSGEEGTYDHGGFRNDDDANGVDGGQRNIRIMKQVRWSVDLVYSWDQNTDAECEKMTLLAATMGEADFTFSHINGTVKGGKGVPVGDIQGNVGNATFPLKISGGGKLKTITGPTVL